MGSGNCTAWLQAQLLASWLHLPSMNTAFQVLLSKPAELCSHQGEAWEAFGAVLTAPQVCNQQQAVNFSSGLWEDCLRWDNSEQVVSILIQPCQTQQRFLPVQAPRRAWRGGSCTAWNGLSCQKAPARAGCSTGAGCSVTEQTLPYKLLITGLGLALRESSKFSSVRCSCCWWCTEGQGKSAAFPGHFLHSSSLKASFCCLLCWLLPEELSPGNC